MPSNIISSRKSQWRKVARTTGLYQYIPNGVYHARVCHGGKLYRESLQTKDLAFARRKLAAFKERLERTDPRYNKVSLIEWLEKNYFPTLKGAPGALKAKRRIIERVRRKWLSARSQPMRDLKESELLRFLNDEYGSWSPSYWNQALGLIRDALAMAVRDHVIMESPAVGLTYRRRKQPIRLTPTFEQFNAIVADIRAHPFNREAEESGDFVEFLGLAGLGQAEAAGLKREHVDLDAGHILIYRHKTSQSFWIPVYPQVRPLVEKLCEGKKDNARLFAISQARKALTNACKRLGFANFTQRSLRRLFITRAIERGVDVKVIAEWQGHRDQGVLILKTYSHVRAEHSQRMAQLMSTEQPPNVISMPTEKAL